MVFVACGINHKTAPIGIREQIAPCIDTQKQILQELVNQQPVREAALLTTCNRTELYCDTEDASVLIPWLADKHAVEADALESYSYLHQSHEGIRHTMRVACGLDSKMLGEPQILGQMKQAYQQALAFGTAGSELSHIFRHVFSTSKRVRNNTDIGVNPISVAFAAVHLTKTIFKSLSELSVLLIGTGETTTSVANYLRDSGVKRFFIASRTQQKADQLAKSFDGTGLVIGDIAQYMHQADIVITATACPLPFITRLQIETVMQKRGYKPMFLLDLAVPRDIEVEAARCHNVHLYNVDDMQDVVEQGLSKRQSAARLAEEIIDGEVTNFFRWRQAKNANSIIHNFRQQMGVLGNLETERALALLDNGHPPEAVIRELSRRLVNKLIHQPTTKLREAAYDGRDDLLELAIHLYDANNKA